MTKRFSKDIAVSPLKRRSKNDSSRKKQKKTSADGVRSPVTHSVTAAERNAVVESDLDFEEQPKIPVPTRLPLKVGCYKTNIENRFKAKLQVCSSYEAINIIRKKLSNSQTSLFQKSIFGRFLDLLEFKIQNQLLHHLFFHEIY